MSLYLSTDQPQSQLIPIPIKMTGSSIALEIPQGGRRITREYEGPLRTKAVGSGRIEYRNRNWALTGQTGHAVSPLHPIRFQIIMTMTKDLHSL